MTLVVHHKAHFILLYGAWRRWSNAWGIAPEHAGIVMLPQTWSSARIVEEIHLILNHQPHLTNQLWHWQPKAGWADRS